MDKLGIYIPTFNRERELKECLESFIPQVEGYNLPIYISDNSTTQNTERLVRMMKKRYNKIYYRKSQYIGKGRTYALNLRSVFEMGDTEYVWFFGDDDVIKAGAIKRVIDNIKDNDFLQINTSVYNNDLSKKLTDRTIDKIEDIVYMDGDHSQVMLNARKYGYVGFMAGIITRRVLLDEQLSKLHNVRNMDFLHTFLHYRAIVGKKGKLLAAPVIKYRTGAELGRRLIEIWMVSFPKTLDMLSKWYKADVLRVIADWKVYDLIGMAYYIRNKYPEEAAIASKSIMSNGYINYIKKVPAYLILNISIVYYIFGFFRSLKNLKKIFQG